MLEVCNGEAVTFTTAKGFLAMAKAAEDGKRNRSVYVEELKPYLADDGKNVLKMRMLHNDVEWRTWWFVAVKHGTPGSTDAGEVSMLELCLDVGFEEFDYYTETVKVEDIKQKLET
jgi:hypothetical protein